MNVTKAKVSYSFDYPFARWSALLPGALTVVLLTCAQLAHAATIWNGARISFSKSGADDPTLPANQDRITPNVWLTRASSRGLYNANAETGFTHTFSPAGTEWANGATSNYSTLSYTDWNSWAKGVNPSPPATVGVPAVVHLIAEDIYIDITFTSWSPGGNFSYQRATPPGSENLPPTVTITNPPNNITLHPPASFVLGASASDSDGSVTNVQFFQGAAPLGNSASSPYSAAVNNLPAGDYTFSAIATDDGGSTATNSILVHVAFLPPSIAITNPPNNITIAPPASFVLRASATDPDGVVTNVQFFQDATAIGNSPSGPYSVGVTNLPVGDYTFSAIATDNDGIMATNAISVHVGTPPPVIGGGSLQRPSGSSFQFSYSAVLGFNYVIQRSLDLIDWTSMATNTATNDPMTFLDSTATATRGVYRVGRLPNP